MAKLSTMRRANWLNAYRYARALKLGTLFTTFDRETAAAAINAQGWVRVEPMLPAYLFKQYGLYRQGFKRI